jgi:hypothetical protein
MYLTATSQNVDFNMPAGRYKVYFTGAQTLYTANDATLFTLSFQSQNTRIKYGNVPYMQISLPHTKHAKIQGDICWEIDYNGPFNISIIDVSTGVAPVADRFTSGMYYFNVEPISPNQNIKF